MNPDLRRMRLLGLAVMAVLAGLYVAAWRLPDPLASVVLPMPSAVVARSATGGSRLLRWRSVTYDVAAEASAVRTDMAARLAADGWQPRGDEWSRAGLSLRLRVDSGDAGRCRVLLLLTRR
ncbi:MAG: hypothetical protein HZB16_01735 [Armatimonadetes bacterium]|nr:hypothetical protein [Armatimonadota bacterium]